MKNKALTIATLAGLLATESVERVLSDAVVMRKPRKNHRMAKNKKQKLSISKLSCKINMRKRRGLS